MVVLLARQLSSSRRLVIGRFPHAICITIEYSDEDVPLLCINIALQREVLRGVRVKVPTAHFERKYTSLARMDVSPPVTCTVRQRAARAV